MTEQNPTLLARVGRDINRRLREARNTIEWSVAQRSPWCRNRWGHRYQVESLTEYHYLRDGNPETHEAALLERLLRPGMTVLDVGANRGLFTLEAAHFVGESGTIHAFEPTPATRARLIANLQANGLDHVRVLGSAISETPGRARLRVHHRWTGLNTLADHDITWLGTELAADEIVEVPVTTLDHHAESTGLGLIDFLKIDIEGFELFAIRGARRLLSAQRVRWLMLEVGDGTCANAHVQPGAILDELQKYHYELHTIEPDGSIGSQVERFPERSFSANFLAFPRA